MLPIINHGWQTACMVLLAKGTALAQGLHWSDRFNNISALWVFWESLGRWGYRSSMMLPIVLLKKLQLLDGSTSFSWHASGGLTNIDKIPHGARTRSISALLLMSALAFFGKSRVCLFGLFKGGRRQGIGTRPLAIAVIVFIFCSKNRNNLIVRTIFFS